MKKIIPSLLFVLMLLPYVSFVPLPFDTQPYALVCVALYITYAFLRKEIRIPQSIKILIGVTVYAAAAFGILLLMGKADMLGGLRSLSGYVSWIVFALFGYICRDEIFGAAFMIGVVAWLYGALMQLAFGLGSVAWLLPRFSTGGYRGLTSLAPEPAYYATACICMLVLNEYFYMKGNYGRAVYWTAFLASIVGITLSYSGAGLLLLAAFAGAKVVEVLFGAPDRPTRLRGILCVGIIGIALSLFFLGKVFGGTRGGHVLTQSISHPAALASSDLSVSYRLINPVLAVYGGIVETHGIGFGIGAKEGRPLPTWLAWKLGKVRLFGGRIQGGLFQPVYELGLIGFIVPAVVLLVLWESVRRKSRMRAVFIVSALVVFGPLFIFGPIATPLFGFLFGLHVRHAESDAD